jgi:hypothetical protein
MTTSADEFHRAWPDGYYEGDPLDPHGLSSYQGAESAMSVLHATYLRCIKPYINRHVKAIEIGCGRGTWSGCMLGAKELWCIDVQSAEQTKFPYLDKPNVNYVQMPVPDMSSFEDFYFDYCFSFGALCHTPMEIIEAYARNLFKKMKPGANVFWMVADDDKYFKVTGRHIPDKGIAPWFNAGITETCIMLEQVGYTIMDPDVGTILRDPIIHFMRQ